MSFLTSNQPPFISSHSINSTAVSTGLSECRHVFAGVQSTLIFLTLPPHINPTPLMSVLSQHLLWSKTPFAKAGAPPSELTGKQSWALSLRRAVSPSVLPLSAPSLSLLWLWSPRVVSGRAPELQPKFMSLMSFCAVQSLGNIRAQISRMSQTSPEGTGIWKGTAQCSP